MKEKDLILLFTCEYKVLFKLLKEVFVKFFIILIIVVLRRIAELAYELLSAKVFIPLLFIVAAGYFNVAGSDEIINSVLGAIMASGSLFYKYLKDKRNAK